jgi:hypothetical protein
MVVAMVVVVVLRPVLSGFGVYSTSVAQPMYVYDG